MAPEAPELGVVSGRPVTILAVKRAGYAPNPPARLSMAAIQVDAGGQGLEDTGDIRLL